GRDVIAIKKGICSIRVIDQVKAYKPPHLVTANDVRALVGVLYEDGASKACLSTTSDFAPMLKTDPLMVPLIPSRLELVNGPTLLGAVFHIGIAYPIYGCLAALHPDPAAESAPSPSGLCGFWPCAPIGHGESDRSRFQCPAA